MIMVSMGHMACCVLGLDDEGVRQALGVVRLGATQTTALLSMDEDAARGLISEINDRLAPGWDLEPGERAALRRAEQAITKML